MDETQKKRRARKLKYARHLRQRMTKAEAILWNALRNRKCANLKFRRQSPLLWFIPDFVCMEHRLIIEIDGSIHATQITYDRERDEELSHLGYSIIRFTNDQIVYDLQTCLERIIHESQSKNRSLS